MEVKEVVATLFVTGGVKRQCLERLVLHGVVPVLVSVNVLSKIKEAMLAELDGLANIDGSWAQRSRDAILDRESVDKEHHGIDELVYKDSWDATVYSYELCVHRLNALLHCPVEAIDFWNMIIPYRCVHLNLYVSEHRSGRLEFLICPEFDDIEAPICIVGLDRLHRLHH